MPRISKVKTTKFYKRLIVGFFGITAIILGLIVYYSFSKTAITITLVPQEKTTSFVADIKKEMTEEETAAGQKLNGYLVSTVVSGAETFVNDSEGDLVEAPATGKVTIYNNWTTEQPLAATTRLLTPEGILFRIKDRVDVPAGGKVEDVEVYADVAGVTGNIESTAFTIPGLWEGLQDKIYAESTEPMTGGLRQVTILTQEMIDEAAATLKTELLKEAESELALDEEVQIKQDQILNQAITAIIFEQTTSAEIGEEVDSFIINMTIKAVAAIFNENELMARAVSELGAELADDEKLESYSQDKLTYSINEYNLEDQTASLAVKLTAEVVPRPSSPIFNRQKLAGLDLQEINEYFSNYDEVGEVKVNFSPFWVTKAPSLADHIEIKIQ